MSVTELGIGKIITTPQERDAIHVALTPVVAGEELQPGQHVGVMLCEDGRYHAHTGAFPNIGIVDPFLIESVKESQECWLFLYPNTVTSLRHEWTHPAFSKATRQEVKTLNEGCPWRTPTVIAICTKLRESNYYHQDDMKVLSDALEDAGYPHAEHLKALRNNDCSEAKAQRIVSLVYSDETAKAVTWIEEFASRMELTFERLLRAAQSYNQDSFNYTMDNTEAYKNSTSEEWATFWKHYALITNTKVNETIKNDPWDNVPFTCSC